MTALQLLAEAAAEFSRDVMRGFLKDKFGRSSVETFLGRGLPKLAKREKKRRRQHTSRDDQRRSKQRILSRDRKIEPLWDCYTDAGDSARTKAQHEKAIKKHMIAYANYQSLHPSAVTMREPDSIDTTGVDPRALTALLNIIAKVNPAVRPDDVSGYPDAAKKTRGYKRKLSSFQHMHGGRSI